MKPEVPILVVTDAVSDAEMIANLLREEFGEVAVSTNPDHAVRDFEERSPSVLVLAFNTLEKAERHYLGLYRRSEKIHALPHRTLILCNKDDLRRVYELCCQEYFDDYILFWPMAHDAFRLRMSIHNALRQIEGAGDGQPTGREFAAQARRIAELESLLERHAAQGFRHIEAAGDSVACTERGIGEALDRFTAALADGSRPDLAEVRDRAGFQREIDRLKSDEIGRCLESVNAAIHPMRRWVEDFQGEMAPHLESARVLQAMADRIRPLLLVVDDDPLQCRLVGAVLEESGMEPIYAENGMEALHVLRRRRPDLILMDVRMPGIDGIEVTRRLKATKTLASIPVVMITGRGDRQAVMESLQAGAADFLAKPFDRETLLRRLRPLLPGLLPGGDPD